MSGAVKNTLQRGKDYNAFNSPILFNTDRFREHVWRLEMLEMALWETELLERNAVSLLYYCIDFFSSVDPSLSDFCFASSFKEKRKKRLESYSFTFMWPCIVTNLFIIKPTRCTNFPHLFWHETLHVSDSSFVRHQEFIHCTLSNGMCHTGL
jgi:hypothetical protein